MNNTHMPSQNESRTEWFDQFTSQSTPQSPSGPSMTTFDVDDGPGIHGIISRTDVVLFVDPNEPANTEEAKAEESQADEPQAHKPQADLFKRERVPEYLIKSLNSFSSYQLKALNTPLNRTKLQIKITSLGSNKRDLKLPGPDAFITATLIAINKLMSEQEVAASRNIPTYTQKFVNQLDASLLVLDDQSDTFFVVPIARNREVEDGELLVEVTTAAVLEALQTQLEWYTSQTFHLGDYPDIGFKLQPVERQIPDENILLLKVVVPWKYLALIGQPTNFFFDQFMKDETGQVQPYEILDQYFGYDPTNPQPDFQAIHLYKNKNEDLVIKGFIILHKKSEMLPRHDVDGFKCTVLDRAQWLSHHSPSMVYTGNTGSQ
ncbi:uncharacterized protein CYBJADRAFT_160041 [Cyberlindnera jadinii NRRL Y-1542]|uniref:Uncharacterized protein n=1 Tax=Cyberlindnera jadinii (strain ATCC 18201 / CBS 1600 / BCRC 20928 / JCM 3617 / NBRC 0987 / NRRL Y-1542) TaxID=983966 RepID=A0A1E4S9I0_CYBJN|nr:hypothetical protein CYBJADRAFT_160041 [Cyberlindnera jadinii NRRL Y-1542]ODV76042.1 hypothetical protein CYBJADRAFT_160041 [Cyberlindnera jadinii NRRL Y-1542]